MLKRSVCCFFLILCVAPPSLGLAFGREQRAGGRWWRLPMVAEKLDLTEEHRKKLDQLFLENRRNLIDLRSSLERERLDLGEMLDKEPFDESMLMGQFRKLENTRSKLAAERFHYLLEVRKILGADRFRKLEGLYGAFKEKLRRGLPDAQGSPDR